MLYLVFKWSSSVRFFFELLCLLKSGLLYSQLLPIVKEICGQIQSVSFPKKEGAVSPVQPSSFSRLNKRLWLRE